MNKTFGSRIVALTTALVVGGGALVSVPARAQSAAPATSLDSLIGVAVAANPTIKAAQQRVNAARARVGPAGLPPDPMLMAGIENLALGPEPATVCEHGGTGPGGPDPMTMRMVGIEQTIPFPGKLGLQRNAAARDVDASQAALDGAREPVTRDVKAAYYELAFIDQAFGIVERNRDVLAGFIRITETQYSVGAGAQQDILKARLEATGLAETAATLTDQRRAALARLNALLDRPTDTPVEHPVVPANIARAAVPPSIGDIHFISAALGAQAADSPLPALAQLQATAVEHNPEIREHEATIAAQIAKLALARKSALPDAEVSLQYGHRANGIPDMLSANVSVPLPVFKHHKQDQLVAEADAQLAALRAEHEAKANDVRADVARLVSELERSRTQLALYASALLPQARASLTSATSSYQVGKVEFLTVLDAQAAVFKYETDYFRAMSDFATNLAELERVVGMEVVQ